MPQESILGPELFNNFVGSAGKGTEHTLSKFASDSKWTGAVDVLEGRDAIRKQVCKVGL